MNSCGWSVMTCWLGTAAAVILVSEGDAAFIERDQAPVRDGDPVRVAREIGEHRFGSGKGWLGVDMPLLVPERREMTNECPPLFEAF